MCHQQLDSVNKTFKILFKNIHSIFFVDAILLIFFTFLRILFQIWFMPCIGICYTNSSLACIISKIASFCSSFYISFLGFSSSPWAKSAPGLKPGTLFLLHHHCLSKCVNPFLWLFLFPWQHRSMWKFPGRELNPFHSSDPSHGSDNIGSLTAMPPGNSPMTFNIKYILIIP